MAGSEQSATATDRHEPSDGETIRPLAPEDLPAAAALVEHTLQTGSSLSGIERLLREVAFGDPWGRKDPQSLALIDGEGTLTGLFLGCARRLRVGGATRLAVCGSNVIVAPGRRGRGQGIALLERALAGPQALSYTDGSPDRARRLLQRMGFTLLQLESLEWTSVLRPTAYWQGRLLAGGRGEQLARRGRLLTRTLDRALGRTPFAPAVRAPGLRREPLTPQLMLEHIDTFTAWARVRLDYDEPFLTWLFEQLSNDHPQGRFAARLVRRDGKAIGWHISLVPEGGVAHVLQLVAHPRDLSEVLASALVHARELRAVAARGRLEAPLLDAITTRRSVLRRHSYVLVKDHGEPQLIDAIRDGRALFTQLDGDWWIDPHGR